MVRILTLTKSCAQHFVGIVFVSSLIEVVLRGLSTLNKPVSFSLLSLRPQGINDDQSLGANFGYREVKRVSQQLIFSIVGNGTVLSQCQQLQEG